MGRDFTDQVMDEWQAARPDLDTSTIAVVARILRLASYLQTELEQGATDAGLSTKGDFDTLAALRRQTPRHELSPTRLADAALITTGGMTSRLDRLEDAGLVERHDDPSDRRALVIRLTDEGRTLVDQILESNLEKQDYLLVALDAGERSALAQLLRRLLINLGDE
jgi:DNA-binding MarR family transcriptional regulator